MKKYIKRLYWFLHFLFGDYPFRRVEDVPTSIKTAWKCSGFVMKSGGNI